MEQIRETYYRLEAAEVVRVLGSDIESGLTDKEADKRLLQYGRNIVEEKRKKSVFKTLVEQFYNPIVWILVVAASVAFVFGQTLEGFAVGIVVVINTLIGFFMERQAIRSMEKLRSMARIRSKVLRNGTWSEIDSALLVPGDMLYLESGDVVPADARLVAQNNLAVKEAALTGESVQVEKSTEVLQGEVPVADRVNTLFKGTIVSRGNGRAVVVATGAATELGKITELTEEAKKEATPLNKKLKRLTRNLVWLTLFLAVIIFLSGLLRGANVSLMIQTAIALAIASIPEGLPVISTVALARGMLRLADRNVIVKNLESVQTLGETEVIFTDKTGTLTENEMHVQRVEFSDARFDLSVQGNAWEMLRQHPGYERFLKVAVLCNNGMLGDGNKTFGDPVDIALLKMAARLSENIGAIREAHPRIAEVPFDSRIKMMGTAHRNHSKILIAVKGATEAVLENCTQVQEGNRIIGLLEHETWIRKTNDMANQGLRVLSYAYRLIDREPTDDNFIHNLIFLGLTGFIDPPRRDVKDSISDCLQAGIKVVVVTGDHAGTANAIARQIGLTPEKEIISIQGRELLTGELSNELKQKILKAHVFSRVDPAQKLKLISVYQERKLTVGMTGDGVNDAPALKKADIGIAMGIRGTDAAKEAADLILKDDAFPSIVTAVKYGRVIFDNIRTFVVYLLSCNLSEIIIVAMAAFFGMPLPLLPLQILFLNMITDVFPALAIGMSEGDESIVMKEKPRRSSEPIVSTPHWVSIGVYALCLSVAVLGMEVYALYYRKLDHTTINNLTFYTLILAQLWNVLNMSPREVSFFDNQITRNKYIWYAIAFSIAVTWVVYIFPVLRQALSLVPLNFRLIVLILAASFFPVLLVQLLKRVFKWIK